MKKIGEISNNTNLEKAFKEIKSYNEKIMEDRKMGPLDDDFSAKESFQQEMTAFVSECFKKHGINKAFKVSLPFDTDETGENCLCYSIEYELVENSRVWSWAFRTFMTPYDKWKKTGCDRTLCDLFDEIRESYAGEDKNDNISKICKGEITEEALRNEIKIFAENFIALYPLEGKVKVSKPGLTCDLSCLSFNVAVTYNDNGERKTARRRFETLY